MRERARKDLEVWSRTYIHTHTRTQIHTYTHIHEQPLWRYAPGGIVEREGEALLCQVTDHPAVLCVSVPCLLGDCHGRRQDRPDIPLPSQKIDHPSFSFLIRLSIYTQREIDSPAHVSNPHKAHHLPLPPNTSSSSHQAPPPHRRLLPPSLSSEHGSGCYSAVAAGEAAAVASYYHIACLCLGGGEKTK